MAPNQVELRRPSLAELPGYKAALEQGWSADNVRAGVAAEELARIAADPAAFVASLDDREAKGGPITLPDGSQVPRLPSFRRWLWGGEFCGSIGFRWQPGTSDLPAHVLGHIGYGVVPWKRNLGYATRALALILPEAKAVGLDYVDLTTDPDNLPSQGVILANGGRLMGPFHKQKAYGNSESLLFRITL